VVEDTGLVRTQKCTSIYKGGQEAISSVTALSRPFSAVQVREQSNAKCKPSPISACSGTAEAHGTPRNRDELSLRS